MSKRILLFPGQGSQYVGMGKSLAKSFASAGSILENADAVLGFSLSKLMFEGPEDELKLTQNTQPAIFTVSMMVQELLEEKNMAFDFVAGHSLGEYSALCAAGVFSFEEGLKLVRLRGMLMAQAGEKRPGAMAAILGMEAASLAQVLAEANSQGIVVMANHNSLTQLVVSGELEAVNLACRLAQEAGAKKTIMLPVSGAFHSPLMEFAVPGLQAGLENVCFNKPKAPVISNVDASPCTEPAVLKELLVRQLSSPVRWVECMHKALELDCTAGMEVGPGKVLMGLARGISRDLKVAPIENEQDLQAAMQVREV